MYIIIFSIKNGINSTINFYSSSHKLIPIIWEKTFKRIWHIYIAPARMKVTNVILVYVSMFPMKNQLNIINTLYIGSHKIFPILTAYGGEFLKQNLVYLNSTKCNEMNAFH